MINYTYILYHLIEEFSKCVMHFPRDRACLEMYTEVGVDRLSAPILSILPIIDIGHFKNRFADNIFYFYFFNANKHTIYR